MVGIIADHFSFIMAKLETQYKNYLKRNPDSKLSFEEWKNELFKSLAKDLNEDFYDWDVTLNDGLENEPYISDDFQIGPNGAFEYSERSLDFKQTLNEVSLKLKVVEYENGDISDLGNEIGIAVGTVIEGMTETEISVFISGFKHGVSLTNGTH